MNKATEKKVKRTRWETTNNAIRQLLIDFYVKSPVFDIIQEFSESVKTFDDPNFNKRSKRKYDENPINILPDNNLFKQEDTDRINLAWFVVNSILEKTMNAIENPLWKWKWDLTWDSFNALEYREKNTKRPLQDVKKKYNLSYPTLHDRLPLFFDIKIDPKWRTHYKYLCPKKDVFMALSRYYTERKIYRWKKNVYLEIVDLFKNIEI